MGETSADELIIQSATSENEVDIFQASNLQKRYKESELLATAVEDYEHTVVEKHLGKDLCRVKGKNRSKISFKDLTVGENLNYIKYNLTSSKEAYQLFDITKEAFEHYPAELSASLIQKLANHTKDIDKDSVVQSITTPVQYKSILKEFQKSIADLDNKQFVDTVFSFGKLHKN